MSKRKAYYTSKVKRATHMLFYKKHKKPGVKGWELRKTIGSDYPKVLRIMDDFLKPLDLQVKPSLKKGNRLKNPLKNSWIKPDSSLNCEENWHQKKPK